MLEIVGRMQRLNRAGQIRVADELFGGTGGERFVELLSQGEQGLRSTIARAHELGAVMDAQMLAKADELDRKWRDLTLRVSNYGKAVAVALADAPYDMVQTRLREIFDEAEGRSILGDDIYDQLSRISDLSDEQVESLRGLLAEYGQLEDAARLASAQMAQAGNMAQMQGFKDLAAALFDASNRLREISDEFAGGTMEGETFQAKLAEIQQDARGAFDALDAADRVDFGLAISEVDRLGGVIETVVSRAKQLFDWLRAASGMAPAGTGNDPVPPTPEFTFAAGMNSPDALWGSYGGYDPSKPVKGSTRGGGGGKDKRNSGRIDALVSDLQTERELLTSWFTEAQELLAGATATELEAIGGHNEAKLRLAQEYVDRLREIESLAQQERLAGWSGALGDLASLMQTGNAKLFKIGQASAIAQASVDGYSAAVSAWDKGMKIGGPPVAAAFTAASLARTGALIAQIKSASPSGSGGGASSSGGGAAATATATEKPQDVILELRGRSRFTIDEVEDMITQIQKASKNGVNITTVRS